MMVRLMTISHMNSLTLTQILDTKALEVKVSVAAGIP
jgi:hypothetical protein